MIRALFLLFVSCLIHAGPLQAQQVEYGKTTISVGGGAFIYLGDLSPQRFGDVSKACGGMQIALNNPVNDKLSIRGNFVRGSLDGDDKRYDDWRPRRSFSFTSRVTEVALMAQWAFRGQNWEWPEDDRYTRDFRVRRPKIFSPYFFVGLGYLHNELSRNMDGIDSVFFYGDVAWTNYAQEKSTTYKAGMIVAPVGLGAHITIGHSVRFYAEYCYHALFNDHLDGFSKAVVSNKPDAYQTITAGLDFRFIKHGTRRKKEVCNLNL